MRDPVWFRGGGGGGAAVGAPALLWEIDHRLTTRDWLSDPPADLNGLAVALATVGPPKTWGTDGVNGLVIDDDGAVNAYGRYVITMAAVATLAATGSRALDRQDSIIICSEFQTATPAQIANHQIAEVWAATTGPANYNALAGMQIAPSVSQRIGVYNSGWGTVNSVTPLTSVLLQIGTDRGQGWSSTNVLDTAAVVVPTYGPIQMPGINQGHVIDRTGAAVDWSPADSVGTIAISQNKIRNEATVMYEVRSQIWVMPGTAYTPP